MPVPQQGALSMKVISLSLVRIAFGLTLAAAAIAAIASPATPPVAPVRDTAESMHGVTVHDPYRYMENVKDPEVLAWMKAQGDYARQTLDAIPGRAEMLQRVSQLSKMTGDAISEMIRMPGDKVFYLRRNKDDRQYKLVLRDKGVDKVLVDPDALAAKAGGVPHAIDYFMPSWDSRYVAYGVSAGGSENATLYILDVATGQSVGEPVPRVVQHQVAWLPDSKSLTFNQLRQLGPEDAESEFYLDSKVMWMKLGAPASEAKAVFGPTVNKQLGLVRLDVGSLVFSPDSPWVIARTTDTTRLEASLFLARVSDFGNGDIPWKRIATPEDQIVEIHLKGDDLYLRTLKGAPRSKIMKLDLRKPELKLASQVIAAPEGEVIEGINLGRTAILVALRHGQQIGLREYAYGSSTGRQLQLPAPGAAHIGMNELADPYDPDPAHAHDDWIVGFTSWTKPRQVLRVTAGRAVDAKFTAPVNVTGVPELQVTDVLVPSWDGVKVPMTILHRKGLKLDGNSPTLVIGYGSYGLSETAHFSPADYAWYERGGVTAYVNVRGSGAFGEDWHLAGFKQTKPNTWKDGIAATQYLQAHGYGSPKTTAILGGSAGGIFVGRAVTTAPQLYAAAIFAVPMMDGIRFVQSANGITNVSEFGSPDKPDEFKALLEMSTYHQIKDGTPYPAVLFIHGMNDPRVDVWESAKAAARMQAATNSGKPILLRLDAQMGHGIGATATQRDAMIADIDSFLLWQMGKAQAH
jgi:prolyl oligopeptidase